MKKLVILLLLTLMVVSAIAEDKKFAVGLDGGVTRDSYYKGASNEGGFESKSNITPSFSIKINPKIEVAPFIKFGLNRLSNEIKDDDGDLIGGTAKSSSINIGFGTAGYYTVLSTFRFNFAAGLKFGLGFNTEPSGWIYGDISEDGEDAELGEVDVEKFESYSSMDINLSIPVKCEFDINDKIGVRLGVDVAGLYVTSTSQKAVAPEVADGEEEIETEEFKGTNTSLSLFESGPSLGIYFRF
jgi:hypothetical protein